MNRIIVGFIGGAMYGLFLLVALAAAIAFFVFPAYLRSVYGDTASLIAFGVEFVVVCGIVGIAANN